MEDNVNVNNETENSAFDYYLSADRLDIAYQIIDYAKTNVSNMDSSFNEVLNKLEELTDMLYKMGDDSED